MKMLDYLLAPVALAGLVATGWWGLYQSPQRPANLAAQLEQDANAALARNGYDWAHVRMNGQRAVLKGAAPSEDAAMAAVKGFDDILDVGDLGGKDMKDVDFDSLFK